MKRANGTGSITKVKDKKRRKPWTCSQDGMFYYDQLSVFLFTSWQDFHFLFFLYILPIPI